MEHVKGCVANVWEGYGCTCANFPIELAFEDIRVEASKAIAKFPPFNSAHEGHSVLREEVEELWEHVRANTGYSDEAYKEAVQVAAMAVRYMLMIRQGVTR